MRNIYKRLKKLEDKKNNEILVKAFFADGSAKVIRLFDVVKWVDSENNTYDGKKMVDFEMYNREMWLFPLVLRQLITSADGSDSL